MNCSMLFAPTLQDTKVQIDQTKYLTTKSIIGVSVEPLFNVEQANRIIPILHVQINVVSKTFF